VIVFPRCHLSLQTRPRIIDVVGYQMTRDNLLPPLDAEQKQVFLVTSAVAGEIHLAVFQHGIDQNQHITGFHRPVAF